LRLSSAATAAAAAVTAALNINHRPRLSLLNNDHVCCFAVALLLSIRRRHTRRLIGALAATTVTAMVDRFYIPAADLVCMGASAARGPWAGYR